MMAWTWLVLGRRRQLKAILVAGLTAGVLALTATLVISHIIAVSIHNQSQFAIFTFILYFVYGTFYVIGWAIARRLAKRL
jgi:hypothetical protein